MNSSRLWIASAIIAGIIFVGFVFFVPHTRDLKVEPPTRAEKSTPMSSLSVHDLFKKGTHTITGSIEVPDACTFIQARSMLASSTPSTQSILVAISIPKSEGVCLQEPMTVDFSTTIAAPAQTPITASVNGVNVPTTVL